MTLAAVLAIASSGALTILFGSRWLARELEMVDGFIFILLASTTILVAAFDVAAYVIAARNS